MRHPKQRNLSYLEGLALPGLREILRELDALTPRAEWERWRRVRRAVTEQIERLEWIIRLGAAIESKKMLESAHAEGDKRGRPRI